MKKIWLLAKSNMMKSKGQTLSFFVIVLIAALLMNTGLVVWLNYEENFDRQAESQNAADVIFLGTMEEASGKSFLQKLKNDERTREAEAKSILYATVDFNYNEGEQSRSGAFIKKEDTSSIGVMKFAEESTENYDNPIYLPYLFKTGGGYQIGDEFKVTITTVSGEKTMNYIVAGYYEETFFATINTLVCGFVLEAEQYEALAEAVPDEIDGELYQVKLDDQEEADAFISDYSGDLTNGLNSSGLYFTNSYQNLKSARTITSSIGAMLIFSFSIIIALISLVIVKFRIGNSIEEDIKNIGALKAIGYTNGQIVNSILLQFTSITFAGVFAGAALSYLVLPAISNLFAAQTGVRWEQSFDPLSAAVTVGILEVLVAAVSFLTCRKAGRLTPIVSLRSGLKTHSFQRNYCALDKRPGGLSVRMAGKTFFQNGKHNMLVAVIIAAVSFAAVFAGVMYWNTLMNENGFVSLVSGEVPDVQIYIEAADAEEVNQVQEYVEARSEVREAYFYDTWQANLDGKTDIYCYVTEDFNNVEYQDILYQGRFPEYDNEIAISGLLAAEKQKEIGDTVTIKYGGNEAEFLITGFIQGANYMGRDACLTGEGWKWLNQSYLFNRLYVYLEEGAGTEQLLEDVKDQFAAVNSSINYKDVVNSSLGVYQNAIAMLVVVILAVTIIIVILTLYLVLKTNLIREKRNLGVQKAIGYTTGQLVLQSAMSFIPVVLIGTIAGGGIAWFQMNPLLSVLFSGIGLMKVNFEIAPVMMLGLFLAINLLGFVICWLVSLRIKRITPYALVNE